MTKWMIDDKGRPVTGCYKHDSTDNISLKELATIMGFWFILILLIAGLAILI